MKRKFYIRMEVIVGPYDTRKTVSQVMSSVKLALNDCGLGCKITTARQRGTKVNAVKRGRR